MLRSSRFPWLLVLITVVLLYSTQLYASIISSQALIRLAKQLVVTGDNFYSVKINSEIYEKFSNSQFSAYGAQSSRAGLNYHLAQAAFWSGNTGEAIGILRKHDFDEHTMFSDFLLGYLLWQTGNDDNASQVWSNLPDADRFFQGWGFVSEVNGMYQNMELSYKQLFLMNSENQEAKAGYWYASCMSALTTESTSSDISDCEDEVLLSNFDNYPRLLNFGKELVFNEYYELAAPVLERAAEVDAGRSHWTHYYLGLAYYYQKNYAKAEKAFENGIKISPDFGRGHHWLARTWAKVGEFVPAQIHYEMALDLLPEDTGLIKEYENFQKINK
jgi:tetratricopeptide (TPR) repeat protein